MLFLNKADSVEYLGSFGFADLLPKVEANSLQKIDFDYCVDLNDECGRYYSFASAVADWFTPFSLSVLLVTEFGIWPSRENLHLFQKLRLAYSENKPLFLAPGHLFLDFEKQDLVSLLHLCLLFGWSGILASNQSKVVYFSHDEWVGLSGEESQMVGGGW